MAGEAILIVDDNSTNSKLARVILQGDGFVVQTADDAEAAILLLEQSTPRLILMDLQLPGMDGLELTRRLRRDPRWNQTWIIALTAYAMKGDDEKALRAGCDGYLTKPIEPDTFSSQVAAYLSRQRA